MGINTTPATVRASFSSYTWELCYDFLASNLFQLQREIAATSENQDSS
jgi:hypothetical protein